MAKKFRHKVRGTEYTVIGNASLQNANLCDLREGDNMVVYRGEDGRLWVRHNAEFHDGRFDPVTE